MREILSLVCGSALCLAAALAQNPETTNASPPPTSAQPGWVEPVAAPHSSFYAGVDLLLYWFKPVCEPPPLVSTGTLGQPGTQVLIGAGHKFEFPLTPGGRLTVGWDRGDGHLGLEVSGFVLAQAENHQQFAADAGGSPTTFLPFQNPDGSFGTLPFSGAGVTGSVDSVGFTQVWGVGADFTVPFRFERDGTTVFFRFLAGGRYLDLTDHVRITDVQRLVANPATFAVGEDLFTTRNQFAGAEVGTTVGWECGRWSAALTNKLAGGWTHQVRSIQGSPLLTAPVAGLLPGPLLALPSNIGRETADRVTLVPELALKAELAVTSWCSLSLGYTLLYWNKVLCPGDQMSGVINTSQIPPGTLVGPADPKPLFVHTDYFAQGLEFGVLCRY
jgi:hypothetical protein